MKTEHRICHRFWPQGTGMVARVAAVSTELAYSFLRHHLAALETFLGASPYAASWSWQTGWGSWRVLMLKGSLTFSLHGETVGYTIDCVPWCSSQVCQQANCNCRRILGWPEFLILIGQVTWLGLGSEHVATQVGWNSVAWTWQCEADAFHLS